MAAAPSASFSGAQPAEGAATDGAKTAPPRLTVDTARTI
jgi:hypothetical protein